MHLSADKRRISAEEKAMRFADERCLNCGGYNHCGADCAARKKAQTFKVEGVDIWEVETGTGSE